MAARAANREVANAVAAGAIASARIAARPAEAIVCASAAAAAARPPTDARASTDAKLPSRDGAEETGVAAAEVRAIEVGPDEAAAIVAAASASGVTSWVRRMGEEPAVRAALTSRCRAVA